MGVKLLLLALCAAICCVTAFRHGEYTETVTVESLSSTFGYRNFDPVRVALVTNL